MKKYITSIIFGTTLLLFMSVIIGNAIYQNLIPQKNPGEENSETLRKRIDINWEKIYPFTYPRTFKEEKEKYSSDAMSPIKDRIVDLTAKIEAYATDKMPFRMQLIGLYSNLNHLLGMDFVTGDDTTLELTDNYFVSSVVQQDTTEHSKQIYYFKEFLDTKEIPLLYVQAPYKIDKYDSTYDALEDPINDMGDTLKAQLTDYKINILDLRDVIHEKNLNLYNLFYGTDHHWKVETGLWASGEIVDAVNKNYGLRLDETVFDRAFVNKKYEKRFLGSLGKKVTLNVAKLEDFTEIYPAWKTDLSIEVPNYNYSARGKFEDVIIDRMWLDKTESMDYYNEYIYESYCYGNNSLVKLHNNQTENGKKVLLLSNSFGLVVTPFLALTTEDVIQLHPGFFNGSIKKYIEVELPDIVIILYCPSSIAPITEDGNSSIFVFD